MVANNNIKRLFELATVFALGIIGGSVFLFMGLRLGGVSFPSARAAVFALAVGGSIGFVWMAIRGYHTGRWISGHKHIAPVRSTLAMLERAFPTGMRVAEQAFICVGLAFIGMLLAAVIRALLGYPVRPLSAWVVAWPILGAFGFVWATVRGLRGKGWLRLGANVAPWMDGLGGPEPDESDFGVARKRYWDDVNPATGYPMIGILDSAGNAYGSSAMSSDHDR